MDHAVPLQQSLFDNDNSSSNIDDEEDVNFDDENDYGSHDSTSHNNLIQQRNNPFFIPLNSQQHDGAAEEEEILFTGMSDDRKIANFARATNYLELEDEHHHHHSFADNNNKELSLKQRSTTAAFTSNFNDYSYRTPTRDNQQQEQRLRRNNNKRTLLDQYFEVSASSSPQKRYYNTNWLEVEEDPNCKSSKKNHHNSHFFPSVMTNNHNMIRLALWTKPWLALFATVLVWGTFTILWHSTPTYGNTLVNQTTMFEKSTASSSTNQQTTSSSNNRVLLLPFPNTTLPSQQGQQQPPKLTSPLHHHKPPSEHHLLQDLRKDFEQWMLKHNKQYDSHHEKEKRFHIWTENHHRTQAKNERHGPCKLTNKPVFGANVFSDLTPQEFQSGFLTGYTGPHTDRLEERHLKEVLQPMTHLKHELPHAHPDVQRRLKHHFFNQDKTSKSSSQQQQEQDKPRRNLRLFTSYSGNCKWYDISCWLRWFVNEYGYGVGGTMEPNYDSDSYPEAIDWRDMGVVTSVRSQGSCGACWAITAVETVESAYAMKTGSLQDLTEVEIIVCDDSCQMCDGGWPQNAYEYIMNHRGIPSGNDMYYDGDFLLAMTMTKEGQGDYLSTQDVYDYEYQICPASGKNGISGSNGFARYGYISGYGYTTERCICYTDGTGCDCDEQNEKMALRNVATYGPAVVCLEASTWQDYEGGIMTTEIGCSSAFLDMNHCVQTVGYAFIDNNAEDEGDEQRRLSGSGSGSHSGSRDDGDRDGYWIIRNQWSENWGMNGYAYLAMGSNTCGILNDMTNAFM